LKWRLSIRSLLAVDHGLTLARRAGAEAIAAFALVFAGCGAIIANAHYHGALGSVGISLVFGLIIMVMVYATGHLSGAHINPAVTIAFTARKVFRAVWALPYIVVQFAGAICAALVLQAMYSHIASGSNYPIAKPGGEWRSVVMEFILTAILVTVILNTATGYRSIGHNAALAVGGTVALLGLFASPISGASMNPARTLGPDIVAWDFTGWWIYVVGPIAGAALAVGVIGALRGLPGRAEEEAAEGGALPMSDQRLSAN
jgi:aquaporin Z